MIANKIKKQVLALLDTIEREEEVRIFYACESGSRAWGFASVDSDYDVRFLYAHPKNWYLSIEEGRDVIEKPLNDQMDASGWDIKKGLLLFCKSNPPILEWLCSPLIYLERYSIADHLRKLLPEFYSPTTCLYHYLHMAQGNYREYLQGDVVWVKKYFYVLRPLLACRWIEANLGPVPMSFKELMKKVIPSEELAVAMNELLERKKGGDELARGPKSPVLDHFVVTELKRLEAVKLSLKKQRADTEKLNQLFRYTLKKIWG